MFDTSLLDKTISDRRERLDRERVDLLSTVAKTLRQIRRVYGIREAYLLGSLLIGFRWHQDSDIDVAVGGCSEAVLDVMKELEEATKRDVDVIDLDHQSCPEAFRERGWMLFG